MPAETRFEELKRYVRFDSADAVLLKRFGERAAREFPRIAAEFYDRIREHEGAHAVLQDEAQIARLQRSLVAWLERVCRGPHDENYHEQTAHIGRVHVRIGLPQRYMLTAMALIRIALLRIADRELGAEAAPTREALVRVLDLELAIMLETYRDAFVDRIQHAERVRSAALGSALARVEHRYVSAVELARILIVGLDANGTVQLFNREAERVTGFARDEVLGLPFTQAFAFDDRNELASLLEACLAGAEPARVCETSLRNRAGKNRDVIWHISHAGRQEGDDVVALAMGEDVTDEKALAERTRQAEKLAAIGTLAAGLAHEIRNPLNGAQLHVSFLERAIKRHAPERELTEATEVVAHEIKRLAKLVTEFLDFARPRPLQLKSVALIKLCEHAASLVSAPAAAAGVRVLCDLPSTDVEFQADPDKLLQVLLNLLNNAIEAIDGGGLVLLRARRGPRQVTLEVEDDGPGLSQPNAPIFDAFFSTKDGGTGLGLAISHRIVTDHAGSIEVVSQPRKTVFRVTLPLHRSQEQRI